jgi:hypothetical protein
VRLDGSALLARKVLQTTADRIERFADCDAGVAVDAPRYGHFNADVEMPTVAAVPVRHLTS